MLWKIAPGCAAPPSQQQVGRAEDLVGVERVHRMRRRRRQGQAQRHENGDAEQSREARADVADHGVLLRSSAAKRAPQVYHLRAAAPRFGGDPRPPAQRRNDTRPPGRGQAGVDSAPRTSGLQVGPWRNASSIARDSPAEAGNSSSTSPATLVAIGTPSRYSTRAPATRATFGPGTTVPSRFAGSAAARQTSASSPRPAPHLAHRRDRFGQRELLAASGRR